MVFALVHSVLLLCSSLSFPTRSLFRSFHTFHFIRLFASSSSSSRNSVYLRNKSIQCALAVCVCLNKQYIYIVKKKKTKTQITKSTPPTGTISNIYLSLFLLFAIVLSFSIFFTSWEEMHSLLILILHRPLQVLQLLILIAYQCTQGNVKNKLWTLTHLRRSLLNDSTYRSI